MAKILGVGIATLDIILDVDAYPAEDAEVRARGEQRRRGGNVTNTLTVLSRLGHDCTWAGITTADHDGRWTLDQLRAEGIRVDGVQIENRGKIPTSYILRNVHNGSRTIIHVRDLREYSFNDFKRHDLSRYDWLHFEGRNVPETLHMLRYSQAQWPALPISIEIEKPRPDIEQLFPYAQVLVFSRHYAQAHNYTSARSLLTALHPNISTADLICAWGTSGAEAVDRQGCYYSSPAHIPPQVVDTLGAGDTFNAGIIHGYVQGWPLSQTLAAACKLAGRKCGRVGFDVSVQDISSEIPSA